MSWPTREALVGRRYLMTIVENACVLRFDRVSCDEWLLGVLPENCLLKCSPVRAFEFQIIDYDQDYP